MKRVFDLFFGVILLLSLVIIMLLIAFVIRLTSKGPSLYWSDRIGKNNKIFKMPKFRTMLTETPVVATHLLDNPVVYLSPIGGFLRSTSLDELPQLFSILKGDMSFVGPRPDLPDQINLYHEADKKRLEVRPGITGYAQVMGRNSLGFRERFVYDIEYVEKQSLWFDAKIVIQTIGVVLKRDNVNK